MADNLNYNKEFDNREVRPNQNSRSASTRKASKERLADYTSTEIPVLEEDMVLSSEERNQVSGAMTREEKKRMKELKQKRSFLQGLRNFWTEVLGPDIVDEEDVYSTVEPGIQEELRKAPKAEKILANSMGDRIRVSTLNKTAKRPKDEKSQTKVIENDENEIEIE